MHCTHEKTQIEHTSLQSCCQQTATRTRSTGPHVGWALQISVYQSLAHTHRVSSAVCRSTADRPPRRLIRRQPCRSAATARNGCVPSSKPAGASARLR